MKLAHLAIGILGGDGCHHGADEHLGKTARCRKDHRSDHETEVNGMGKQNRGKGVNEKAEHREKGRDLHHLGNVKFVREEGKHHIHRQLSHKVDENEKT